MIDSKKLLEITQNISPGYHPLTKYDKWLVAVLNQSDDSDSSQKMDYLEYHAQTDEVFILLCGRASILIANGKDGPEDIQIEDMEKFKCYNVKKGVWHNVVLSDGGSVAIVENSDTCEDNSVYYYLSTEEKKRLNDLMKDGVQHDINEKRNT